MRQITRQAISAFYAGRDFRQNNTAVYITDRFTYLALHGNEIAKTDGVNLWVRTCGWNTPTTRERLNGLQDVRVNQRAGVLYLNGAEWSDHEAWTLVK